jgi:methionyl-tRNA synthetase
VPYPSAAAARTPADNAIAKLADESIAEFSRLWNDYQFSRAMETAWGLVSAVDKYIVENEPWAVAEKQDEVSRSRLATILYTSAEALRIVTALAHPIIPDSTSRIWTQLGLGEISQLKLNELKWGQLSVGTKLGKVEAVFPRADKTSIERMQQMEQERSATQAQVASQQPASAAQATTPEPAGTGAQAGQPATQAATGVPSSAAPASGAEQKISIDDFMKVELRVAHVKFAEKVKGADKLLRLEVDLGTEVRQIVAGIAKAYEPEQLIGRKVVIVANLAPRKLRGLESNGMILAASLGDEGLPSLLSPDQDVPPGTKVK